MIKNKSDCSPVHIFSVFISISRLKLFYSKMFVYVLKRGLIEISDQAWHKSVYLKKSVYKVRYRTNGTWILANKGYFHAYMKYSLKCMDNVSISCFHHLLNRIRNEECIPEVWHKGLLVKLPKRETPLCVTKGEKLPCYRSPVKCNVALHCRG